MGRLKNLEAENIEFTKDWNKDGKDVEKAAEFIKKQSVYDGVIVNTSEYIQNVIKEKKTTDTYVSTGRAWPFDVR